MPHADPDRSDAAGLELEEMVRLWKNSTSEPRSIAGNGSGLFTSTSRHAGVQVHNVCP